MYVTITNKSLKNFIKLFSYLFYFFWAGSWILSGLLINFRPPGFNTLDYWLLELSIEVSRGRGLLVKEKGEETDWNDIETFLLLNFLELSFQITLFYRFRSCIDSINRTTVAFNANLASAFHL